jgi:uncharacterized protein involved in type VI secretion and phage assembly
MSILNLFQPTVETYLREGKIWGVVVGIVTNNQDPDELGRVRVKFPWLSEDDESGWAPIATPMAGPSRGIFFLPEVDDEVIVAFEHGDMRKPVVLGNLWNGLDEPPEKNADGENNLRIIKSRSGHTIKLDDTDGSEKVEIIDKTEKNKITIDAAENTITISTDKDIQLKAPQGKIVLEAQDVEIKASASAKMEAGSTMDVEASGTLNLKGQTVNIN